MLLELAIDLSIELKSAVPQHKMMFGGVSKDKKIQRSKRKRTRRRHQKERKNTSVRRRACVLDLTTTQTNGSLAIFVASRHWSFSRQILMYVFRFILYTYTNTSFSLHLLTQSPHGALCQILETAPPGTGRSAGGEKEVGPSEGDEKQRHQNHGVSRSSWLPRLRFISRNIFDLDLTPISTNCESD